MKFALLASLIALLCGCQGSPEWAVDSTTPPKAWTTHPITKHFKPLRASYTLHPNGAVTAHVAQRYFPFRSHREEGHRDLANGLGEYGSWTTDITFHGVTERYWGHYGNDPNWRAMLTVVPRGFKPDPNYETRRAQAYARGELLR